MYSGTSIHTSVKEVVFIRHAESVENVKFQSFIEGLQAMRRLRLPSATSFTSGLSLLRTELDSDLSELGDAQVLDMAEVLRKSSFLELFDPEVVFVSPLRRAKRTVLGVLPGAYTVHPSSSSSSSSSALASQPAAAAAAVPARHSLSTADNPNLNPNPNPNHSLSTADNTDNTCEPDPSAAPPTPNRCHLIELPVLREATPLEHVVSHSLLSRITAFMQILLESPHSRFIVCGHSQFFKRMLRMNVLMRNVDVWRAELCCSAVGGVRHGRWEGLRLVFRSNLAPCHPFDRIPGHVGVADDAAALGSAQFEDSSEGRERHTVSSLNVFDDLASASAPSDGQEFSPDLPPMCRICMCEQSDGSARLIRPCRCTGSQAHVHISCLNRWRSTSTTASNECSVCKFRYRIARTRLAELLMSAEGALAMALFLTLGCVVLSGAVAVLAVSHSGGWDIAGTIYAQSGITPFWRRCLVHPLTASKLHTAASLLASSTFYQERYPLSYAFRLFKAYLHLIATGPGELVYDLLACNHLAATAIDTLFTGAACVGCLGSAHFIHTEIRSLLLNHGGVQGYVHLLFFIASLCSLGHRALGRLGLFVGCAIAGREVYRVMLVHGRRAAQAVGERILEHP